MKWLVCAVIVVGFVAPAAPLAAKGGPVLLETVSGSLGKGPARLSAPRADNATLLAEAPRTPGGDDWVVSETTSPIDYSPVAVATSAPAGLTGLDLQLAIQCRGGRTDLVLISPHGPARAEDGVAAYSVDAGSWVTLPIAIPPGGGGLVVQGDVVRLLLGLPRTGRLGFRLAVRNEPPLQEWFSLVALHGALRRLAGPCRWNVSNQPSRR